MVRLFARVLVANRGEIALRVMRTLRRLGVESVAVYTDTDRDALHVAAADQAVALGPAAAYLDVVRVIAAARRSGADALHPGYGFLSENPVLARRCADEGIAFIGPPAPAMELMGDKITAKRTVAAAGVPVVPGSTGAGLTDDGIAAAAIEIGLPVLLKPSAGGGGKGMRLVAAIDEMRDAIAASRREAMAAFGDDTLLVERYLARPRHIEVQVLADTHGRVVALGERECSLQRRHQKVVEEAPSPLLDQTTRAAMFSSATVVARSCGYQNAGTVEFIVSAEQAGDFYFMEMNTRLQVEHPVTEEVLGLDLVEWQLRLAAGEPLPWPDQASVPPPHGHSVEARIYAEDPDRGFLPSSGRIIRLHEAPAGERAGGRIRVDSALFAGMDVTTDYDPMLSKVVAWAPDRIGALRLLEDALGDTVILGATTNTGFLRRLVGHPRVLAGDIDTGLVEQLAPSLLKLPAGRDVTAAAEMLDRVLAARSGPTADPWKLGDGWRLSGGGTIPTTWRVDGHEATVDAGPARAWLADLDLLVELSGTATRYAWARDGDRTWLGRAGDTWELLRVVDQIDRRHGPLAGTGGVISPMPGTVLAVHVRPGDEVKEGQPLVSVEAMKMEYVVRAPGAGVVRDVLVKAGERVGLDQPLAHIEPGEAGSV